MWMGLVLPAIVSMDLKAANARVSTLLATGGLISSMFMRGGVGRGAKLHIQNTVACIVSEYSFVCSCANLRDGTEFNRIPKGLRSRIAHRYMCQGCGALYMSMKQSDTFIRLPSNTWDVLKSLVKKESFPCLYFYAVIGTRVGVWDNEK